MSADQRSPTARSACSRADGRWWPMHAKDALGRYGEDVAVRHLLDAGWQVLERNWRCRVGEIDIVARDGGVLVFCEVKTRSSALFGVPAEAVRPAKVRRIRALACHWLADRRREAGAGDSGRGLDSCDLADLSGDVELRFDVLSVLCPSQQATQVSIYAGRSNAAGPHSGGSPGRGGGPTGRGGGRPGPRPARAYPYRPAGHLVAGGARPDPRRHRQQRRVVAAATDHPRAVPSQPAQAREQLRSGDGHRGAGGRRCGANRVAGGHRAGGGARPGRPGATGARRAAVLAVAAADVRRVVGASANAAEAALVPDVRVVAVATLRELLDYLRHGHLPARADAVTTPAAPLAADADERRELDLADVVGQPVGRAAVEVAAAGGHHLLLSGDPGAGKTMLAERLPGLLPDLDLEAALEVTVVHSVAGTLPVGSPLVTRPPYLSPHHTATVAALVGGGST